MNGSKNVDDFWGLSGPRRFFNCTDTDNGGSKLPPNLRKFPCNTSVFKNKITTIIGIYIYVFTHKLQQEYGRRLEGCDPTILICAILLTNIISVSLQTYRLVGSRHCICPCPSVRTEPFVGIYWSVLNNLPPLINAIY